LSTSWPSPVVFDERIYARRKSADIDLLALVVPRTILLDVTCIGPSGAARLLVEVGDMAGFADRGHFRVLGRRHCTGRRFLR
jgi:hypothetical protein